MLEDLRMMIGELCKLNPNGSKTTIDKSLTEYLQYHKVHARWFPRMLTEDRQRQQPTWLTNLDDILSLLPLSSGLASNYYIPFFSALTSHLGGTNFKTDEELKAEVVRYLHAMARELWLTIRKMLQRMQKCTDHIK